MRKLIIGIDIDGVLRDFNTAYKAAFINHFPQYKNTDLPKPLKWDYFHEFPWDEIISKARQVPVDLVSKKEIEEFSTNWMYMVAHDDIFVDAPVFFGVIKAIERLKEFCSDKFEIRTITKQSSPLSHLATLKWLSKVGIVLDQYYFVRDFKKKWDFCDIMIDDAPEVINSKPIMGDDFPKQSIKVEHVYNQNCFSDISLNNFSEIETIFPFLSDLQEEFEKVNRRIF